MRTSADAGRALASAGRSWDAAIEYGIDVTLIEHNLQLSVSDRLPQLATSRVFDTSMLATYFALRPPTDG